jgi:hypothetical protein
MSDNKERRVKARHDMTQFYQRKNDVSRREMRRGVMIISGDPNPNNSCRSSDNDIKDDTCDRTTSKMRGFVSQDHIGGFSTKRECANTHK